MTDTPRTRAHLVLADGTVFEGESFAKKGVVTGEAVFSTPATGYEESITDPSFYGQVLVLTSPEIGNVGITLNDAESRDGAPKIRALVTRSLSPIPSNYRSRTTLEAYLEEHGVVGITGVDTRRLTHHLRTHGSQACAVGTAPVVDLAKAAREAPSMEGQNLLPFVTPTEAYSFSEGRGEWKGDERPNMAPAEGPKPKVVVLDFGTKKNILRHLVDLGCDVTVVPASASASDVLAHDPDGIFLTNGPGDPATATEAIATVKALLGTRPVYGICLGHQLLGLALGGRTFKLKFGHRGVNQPVVEVSTNKVEITAQNHGFCVDADSLPAEVVATHRHLNDGTLEGLEVPRLRAASVQFHPEAAAGPHDSAGFFGRFLHAVLEHRSQRTSPPA